MDDRLTPVRARMERIAPPGFTEADVLRRRTRRTLRRRISAGVVAVASFGALVLFAAMAPRGEAPGPAVGDGEDPTRRFVAEANQICFAAQEEFDRRILTRPKATWPLERQARYFRFGLGVFTEMNERLRALMPPRELEAGMTAALEAHQRHLDAVAAAIEAAEAERRPSFERWIRRAFGDLAFEAKDAFERALGYPTDCP